MNSSECEFFKNFIHALEKCIWDKGMLNLTQFDSTFLTNICRKYIFELFKWDNPNKLNVKKLINKVRFHMV
jgi:hypothetical protein